jgi:hypothetical protein
MNTQCQVCTANSDAWLCGVCQRELRDMLRGLAVGQELPNGHRAQGWIANLQDAAWGRAEAAAIKAVDAHISQHRIAELLGVDRMTVRKWVGKR